MSDPSNLDPLLDGGKVASGGLMAVVATWLLKVRGEDRVLAELKEFRSEVNAALEKLSDRFEQRYEALELRLREVETELAESRRRNRDSGIQRAP